MTFHTDEPWPSKKSHGHWGIEPYTNPKFKWPFEKMCCEIGCGCQSWSHPHIRGNPSNWMSTVVCVLLSWLTLCLFFLFRQCLIQFVPGQDSVAWSCLQRTKGHGCCWSRVVPMWMYRIWVYVYGNFYRDDWMIDLIWNGVWLFGFPTFKRMTHHCTLQHKMENKTRWNCWSNVARQARQFFELQIFYSQFSPFRAQRAANNDTPCFTQPETRLCTNRCTSPFLNMRRYGISSLSLGQEGRLLVAGWILPLFTFL